ncbi:MAG: aspartate ammonia-lyase, partial [Fibrobacteres bacterium]|nr:aspartate ammonia-lyase [Fibrobacterota bacterium]
MLNEYRTESDLIGNKSILSSALYGINGARAVENFPLSNRHVNANLISEYGIVKLAALKTIFSLKLSRLSADKEKAVEQACEELAEGLHFGEILSDALQGGAGTSLNMTINEVIANRALQLIGKNPGDYSEISPSEDINRFQSTNDTYPTALRLAAIRMLKSLEKAILTLQEDFQEKEKEFADIVKIGRTEYQDAVLTTLGREMSTYAEALSRDRWRIYKCEERLRVINLGGTAIGTGLAAPREYIFQVAETLRDLTGIGFARAENLCDGTANNDVFIEVSGFLKTVAGNLIKICNDLRLLSSGPSGGYGEITLPAKQTGSSIMPGKVNPVIPEAVTQCAFMVTGLDSALTQACSNGSLELNPFMPLIADCLLTEIELLTNGCNTLSTHCVKGIEANIDNCRRSVEASTAVITALIPLLGYDAAAKLAREAKDKNISIKQIILDNKVLSEKA